MIKNNIFDKNARLNDNIYSPKNKHFNRGMASYVVNLDVLSSGVKSDLDMQKTGSDTRAYIEYKDGANTQIKTLKMK